MIARLEASQTPNKLIYLELTKYLTKMLSHPSIKLDVWEIEATGEIQSFFVIEPCSLVVRTMTLLLRYEYGLVTEVSCYEREYSNHDLHAQ